MAFHFLFILNIIKTPRDSRLALIGASELSVALMLLITSLMNWVLNWLIGILFRITTDSSLHQVAANVLHALTNGYKKSINLLKKSLLAYLIYDML